MKPLTKQLIKSVILVTLKNEFAQLQNKYTDPFCSVVSMFELVSPHIIIDFETKAEVCTGLGDPIDLGDRITDIIVSHSEIERPVLHASDLSAQMIKGLLERAQLEDFKTSLI